MNNTNRSKIFGITFKGRKQYETKIDRSNEELLIQKYCDKFGYLYHKQPKRHVLDYAVFKGKEFRCFVEVKKRSCKKNTYSTYLLSRDKWDAVRSAKMLYGIKSVLLVGWVDCVGYVQISDFDSPHWVWGGRKDRQDADDQELCALINIEKFEIL